MALRDEQVQQFFRGHGIIPDCSYRSAHGWQGGEIVSVSVMDERGNARCEGTGMPMVQLLWNRKDV